MSGIGEHELEAIAGLKDELLQLLGGLLAAERTAVSSSRRVGIRRRRILVGALPPPRPAGGWAACAGCAAGGWVVTFAPTVSRGRCLGDERQSGRRHDKRETTG